MQKLYLDCDGVILDTINKSYEILKKMGIIHPEEIGKFFYDLDWNEFINHAGEIDNSIEKIKKLLSSGLYDIKILTHVYSNVESMAKINYFKVILPEVEVITVMKDVKKADAVDPTGAILVDDYLPNLDYWYEKKGIPVKFSDSGKPSKYTVITDLLDLLSINFEKIM